MNFASSSLLDRNLAPLSVPDSRIVVVDNWSSKAERRAITQRAADHGWTLVPLEANAGFAAGVNAGVQVAERLGCECFLLLNPDASVTADTAQSLRDAAMADPSALVSPCLVTSGGDLVFSGSSLDLSDGRIRGLRRGRCATDRQALPGSSMSWLTAACLAVHRDLWHRLGGLDERFFLYWEDVDLSYRALRAGGHAVLREDLIAVHDSGGTQRSGSGRAKSGTYYYYNCRNRLIFGAHHLGRATLLRWMLHTPRVSWEVLLRGGRRQLLQAPQLLGSAVAGTAAGLVLAARALIAGGPTSMAHGRQG